MAETVQVALLREWKLRPRSSRAESYGCLGRSARGRTNRCAVVSDRLVGLAVGVDRDTSR